MNVSSGREARKRSSVMPIIAITLGARLGSRLAGKPPGGPETQTQCEVPMEYQQITALFIRRGFPRMV